MSIALIVSVSSAVWVIVLCAVFMYEDKRGERKVFVRLRNMLDIAAAAVTAIVARLFGWWGAGRVRLFLHFVLHTVLRTVLRTVRRLEKGVESLLRQNKHHAKKIRLADTESTSHLAEVARYKKDLSARSNRSKL